MDDHEELIALKILYLNALKIIRRFAAREDYWECMDDIKEFMSKDEEFSLKKLGNKNDHPLAPSE